jgi:virginiamycin B lyase
MQSMTRRQALGTLAGATVAAAWPFASAAQPSATLRSWPLKAPKRTGIHDVAPAPDGGVWFTAQASGHLGYFDPAKGTTETIALGKGSAPHGVIQGPDQAAWITDGGQQAIARVSWPSREVRLFRLPEGTPYANLNTCAFDGAGDVWFTGQSGYYGRVAVKTGKVDAWQAPRGRGAYGICATPSGDIWYCSLANSYIARVDLKSGESQVIDPPTKEQGARRVWSDSRGRIWVSEWVAGQLSVYDPASRAWKTYKPPVPNAHVYAVYVDERDHVWISEWTSNAMYRFDPSSEKFERFEFPRSGANVRQILGRRGEVWVGESGTEHISVIATA